VDCYVFPSKEQMLFAWDAPEPAHVLQLYAGEEGEGSLGLEEAMLAGGRGSLVSSGLPPFAFVASRGDTPWMAVAGSKYSALLSTGAACDALRRPVTDVDYTCAKAAFQFQLDATFESVSFDQSTGSFGSGASHTLSMARQQVAGAAIDVKSLPTLPSPLLPSVVPLGQRPTLERVGAPRVAPAVRHVTVFRYTAPVAPLGR
jgi:hypothetical protein